MELTSVWKQIHLREGTESNDNLFVLAIGMVSLVFECVVGKGRRRKGGRGRGRRREGEGGRESEWVIKGEGWWDGGKNEFVINIIHVCVCNNTIIILTVLQLATVHTLYYEDTNIVN